MNAVLQLTGFLAAAWVLSLLADRCYRERLPRDPRELEKVPKTTTTEPAPRVCPADVVHPSSGHRQR
jgi:hypothetical protein